MLICYHGQSLDRVGRGLPKNFTYPRFFRWGSRKILASHHDVQIRPSPCQFDGSMAPPVQGRPKRFIDAEKHYPITHQTETFMQELDKRFGFSPYPWQAHAIQSVLEGHDVIVRVGTAGGKSFTFQTMALSKPKAIVLVISPLIALMENQVPSDLNNFADLRSKSLENWRLRQWQLPAITLRKTNRFGTR